MVQPSARAQRPFPPLSAPAYPALRSARTSARGPLGLLPSAQRALTRARRPASDATSPPIIPLLPSSSPRNGRAHHPAILAGIPPGHASPRSPALPLLTTCVAPHEPTRSRRSPTNPNTSALPLLGAEHPAVEHSPLHLLPGHQSRRRSFSVRPGVHPHTFCPAPSSAARGFLLRSAPVSPCAAEIPRLQ